MKVNIEVQSKSARTWRIVLEIIHAVTQFFKHRHDIAPGQEAAEAALMNLAPYQITEKNGVEVTITILPD